MRFTSAFTCVLRSKVDVANDAYRPAGQSTVISHEVRNITSVFSGSRPVGARAAKKNMLVIFGRRRRDALVYLPVGKYAASPSTRDTGQVGEQERGHMHAIVTGAARGIGRAIALRIARDHRQGSGVRLVLSDQHDGELEALCRELHDLHGASATAVGGDLAQAACIDSIIAAARSMGHLDAIASNAGFSIPGPLIDYDPANWDRVFAVHVRAPWQLARGCHALLQRSRGSIVLTTSISASSPTAPLGPYSPSKAAAVMLARQMALEWGPDGIRTNCVSPGLVATPGTAAIYTEAQAREQREQRIPLRRIGEADEIAAAVSWLLGRDATYVNGAELIVDGGLNTALMSSLNMKGWDARASRSSSTQPEEGSACWA
jgi:NAD(P)-dependent dehydrogenase (short-subunit alcohol dehydrogenase family)